jgi:hypothetical protein
VFQPTVRFARPAAEHTRSASEEVMTIEICEEPIAQLREQAVVPSTFTVERVYDVVPVKGGLGGLALSERTLSAPYEKNYDSTRDGAPEAWSKTFDVSNWGAHRRVHRTASYWRCCRRIQHRGRRYARGAPRSRSSLGHSRVVDVSPNKLLQPTGLGPRLSSQALGGLGEPRR